MSETLQALYDSVKARRRPEDVAELVLKALDGRLSLTEQATISVAARGSLRRKLFAYTSMAQEFARPVGLEQQVDKAQELFASAYPLTAEQCIDPDAVEAFVRHISGEIRKTFGGSDFKDDRLNRAARAAAGLDCSHRQYNKRFRLLSRLEEKLQTLIREWKKREYAMIAKSGLAARLPQEEFTRDIDTACFVAYYTARCNLRSEFTNTSQERPYDQIAATLFARCRRNSNTNWWAIAHVYSCAEVYRHLSDPQKGELLGRWFGLLQEIAVLLQKIWNASDIVRETMIVRRGNDSSTWNQTAGAWNKARDHWIGLVYALGLEDILAAVCPGKALRLMAADVAAWHRISGGGLDKNTFVWSELPLPWEVLLGEAACTLPMIAAACNRHEMDPEKTGWTAPRPKAAVARFRPTPELVHGVTVSNAYLATILRRAGVFSGKPLKPQNLLRRP